jgi:DNA-directed RNA polymerase subunit RPC12/RpoP
LTEAELRTESNKYNAATNSTMGYYDIRNSAENWATVMELYKTGRAKDLSTEPKKGLQPVFLTGSGPSFDDNIEKLKDWKGGIISHYSQACTLMYHGIEPDYIVALDAICNWEGLRGVDWSKTKTKLVLHPGMWPSLVRNWPNEMLFYRQNVGIADAFGMYEQKVMYTEQQATLEDALQSRVALKPLIQTELTMFACTPPAQLFVANVLQYGPVYLMGMDFAYHGNKERFTNYTRETPDDEWVKHEHILPPRDYVKTSNGLDTEPLHLYYKKNFVSALRMSMQQVFTTDHGALTEVPYVPVEKVIKAQGKASKWAIPPDTRKLVYDRYLAGIDCFAVEFENGISFVEVKNAETDITGFIKARNRTYRCTTCGANGTSHDDENHNGGKCDMCGQKTMKILNYGDIESNLKRIRSLVNYHKETT